MKKKQIVFASMALFVAGFFSVNAQQKNATASFATESHDFGKINEVDGPASFQFVLTNTGGAPLIIKNAQPSCGCTTPNWTKEPILPGAKGNINVSFNPQGRPGHFDKSVTVTTNGEPETIVLKINGEVIPKPPSVDEQYPNVIEGLRLKSTQIAMGNLAPDKVSSQKSEVYNSTDQPLKVEFSNIPAHVKIACNPSVIPPKAKANIEVSYDAAAKKDWGFVFDNITVNLNGAAGNNNRISISANIQDDFSNLTPEQKANAPKIEFDNINFDFDSIKSGDKVDHNYKFKNIGKSDLIIRKVQPSCGCTAANLSASTIKPGESGTISTTFNSSGKNGKQQKTITVMTNDPESPRVVLWIKGTVKESAPIPVPATPPPAK